MEVMLGIKLTYAGNKLVELMHLNARVAKLNLSSSKKENSFFLAKDRRYFVINLMNNSSTYVHILNRHILDYNIYSIVSKKKTLQIKSNSVVRVICFRAQEQLVTYSSTFEA